MKRTYIVQCKNCNRKWKVKEKAEDEFKNAMTLECPQCMSVYTNIMIDELLLQDITKLEGKPEEFQDEMITSYFAVSPRKLIVMSIASFGIYELYWFYKQWKLIKESTGRKLSPLARAVFSIFYCHSLFSTVKRSADTAAITWNDKPGMLTVCYVVMLFLSRVENPAWLISFFSFVPLVSAQRIMNQVLERTTPDFDHNDRFSWKNWIVIVLGGFWCLLALLGTFLPE